MSMTLAADASRLCCASGPAAPSLAQAPFTFSPAPPAAEQLLWLAAMDLKQAQEGGAGFSVMAHLQTLISLQPLPFVKIPRTMS